MRNYEVTFIVDPVLSGDEIKATAQTYVDHLREIGAEVVDLDEMGLRQLAFPIHKRTSGVYYSLEFKINDGAFIPKMELALMRDERIIRYLTVRMDKYAVKFNEDRRNGLIGKDRKNKEQEKQQEKPAPKRAAAKAVPVQKKEEEE
ncbi:MAG: 30S ribosomal protein S6 [Bacteroidetes bacterium]|jgi:small subunit ribosomal protein S6|nr:30S ribosomal protein S6 [Bacteroidota bacterium]